MISTLRFSGKMESYIRYRPGYPRRLIDFLYAEHGFTRESVIADIGSGTGVFSRLLLEKGSRVVGIEPDDTMREASERLLSDEFTRYVTISGTAEFTSLPNMSVNHIVCAQSFHHFDYEKCKAEFSRILKPGGSIILIWNRPVFNSNPFLENLAPILSRYCAEVEDLALCKLTPAYFTDFFGSCCFSVLSVPNQQILDFEGIKGRFLVDCGIPEPGQDGYEEMIGEIKTLFDIYNTSGKIIVSYETEAYAGKPVL